MFNFKIDPRTKAVEIAHDNSVAQNITQPNFGITQPDISGNLSIAPRTVTQSSSFDEAMDDLAKKKKGKKGSAPEEEKKTETVEETKETAETTDNSDNEEVYESEKVESDLEEAEEPKKKEYDYGAIRRGGM